MSYPQEFQGIAILDHKEYLHPKKVNFPPKVFGDHDVDIKVECCGVCGSDHHFAKGNWGDVPKPLVCGHEIIGKVVKVGDNCETGVKVGDRVGVGAECFACLKCDRCKSDNEQYCEHQVWTLSKAYEDGYVSKGGFANYVRVHEHFAIPIPENLDSVTSAPLMCGGITVFSPLLRNGCGPGKKVGIMGIGGIGHMGIMLAKAMGAEVYAISRSNAKKEDALKLGADHYIATKEEADWDTKYKDALDLVIICAGSLSDIDFDRLPTIMNIGGKIVSIAAPDATEKVILNPLGLLGVSISNSALGSRKEIIQLLKLASEKNIKPWVETLPISEAGVGEAFGRMDTGDVRYRFTMVDYDKELSN
ncbi:NADP-dependent alcohol dehydrogenase [Maudiozyma humilis]|uniref:alcohol dehydrogenase (NADP(+)) n=1 Tax=Maudiozyma humilis TaxID=51915 RepID=A0AAV5S5V8_MAUHU|nr:NADP-dependent alcohol dehydrogenase [Kazachstania humilis]